MKKSLFIVMAAVLMGCASTSKDTVSYSPEWVRNKGYSPSLRKPDPAAPNVFIEDGNIVVDQEPIRPKRGMDPVQIYWALEDGGKYVFPDKEAIQFKGHTDKKDDPQGLECKAIGQYVFACKYVRPAPGTVYKYTINVRDNGSNAMLQALDPTVRN